MFFIITGKPGASKTLHAIALVEKMRSDAKKQRGVQRPVYYWNIGDVTLDGWKALGDASTFDLAHDGIEPDLSEVLLWYKLPRDSIIVIDECQKFWPIRPRGAAVPPHVEHLETHRKAGYDIVGISQDPTLIDTHVRKLCGRHTHYRRLYGTETYHSFTWEARCVTDVESTSEQSKSLESRGKFPKHYYGTYRSAQVHNVKAQLPWKWIASIAAAVVAFPLLVYAGIEMLRPEEVPQLTEEQLQRSLEAERRRTVEDVVTHVRAIMAENPWDERLHRARVVGVDASQPFYDELIQPVSFPKVRGCGSHVINGKVDCQCYSQQGTRLAVSTKQCLAYIKRGWFDFTKEDEEEAPRNEGPVPIESPIQATVPTSSGGVL